MGPSTKKELAACSCWHNSVCITSEKRPTSFYLLHTTATYRCSASGCSNRSGTFYVRSGPYLTSDHLLVAIPTLNSFATLSLQQSGRFLTMQHTVHFIRAECCLQFLICIEMSGVMVLLCRSSPTSSWWWLSLHELGAGSPQPALPSSARVLSLSVRRHHGLSQDPRWVAF
jgi:hypothetical protein